MKHSLIALAVALATCTAAVTAHAQTASAKKPAATKKAAVKKTAVKKKKTTTKKATSKAAPQQTTAAPAAPTMVPDTAGGFPVFTGDFRCDEGLASITPQGNEFAVRVPGGRHYTLRRVPTTTGVVRLENASRTAYWLQSGNKSMMIDTQAGGRVADGCRNAVQQARENELRTNPSASLL